MDKERILVVDDDKQWHSTVALMLQGEYELKFAIAPAMALELAGEFPFALAILDQRIGPDVSGIQLLGQLRAIQPDLRAIILTGYAEVEDAEDSMLRGAIGYLSKGMRNLGEAVRARVAGALGSRLESIASLIRKGESAGLEFKSSARWDLRQDKQNRELEAVIVKIVASFLNSDGGVLLIGVSDDGDLLGLQHDYQTLGKKDRDGFEAFLFKLLLDSFGRDLGLFIRIDFDVIDEMEVCRVIARQAPKPIYVGDGDHLYIRTGNSTRELSAREAVEYCKVRWK